MKYQNYIEGSLGKSHKKLVKVGQHWTQEQVAKIRNLQNSAGCENFATLQNSTVFQILSLFIPFSF